ncbi:ectoine hydroxylase-related dioxygenase (phytanoyl-CoA dioxygenase family) [Kribbella sp. VKM Ac-2571]|uniref:phytanoyl-CoA dioxygenase family protein n=1 Tax=Kribbella sp. VKM Ac-2571 TaxID=2512222 RepID=UPI0010D02E5E|nr:phytanoyl-CoA dioxygenase family protein [Kribbella sp. VKM Ac-2571]TDO60865.1 ectoine hydroxylase-related dioxygenase (phytanoyl-CoA dioxygenase family) [Kribbella sp. VKM Ac-2571]
MSSTTADSIARATADARVDEFFRDGYCAVERAVTDERLSQVAEAFTRFFAAKQRRARMTGSDLANHGKSRWNALLPSTTDFLAADLIAAPPILAVLEGIRKRLGDQRRWVLRLAGSDICLPGSVDQLPHRDVGTFDVTCNLFLTEVGEESGPTEVWPGTHQHSAVHAVAPDPHEFLRDVPLSPDEWIRLSAERDSQLLTVPAGTVVIRDQRMIHRGTANRSEQDRPMLSYNYSLIDDIAPIAYRSIASTALSITSAMRRRGMRLSSAGRESGASFFAAADVASIEFLRAAATDRLAKRRLPIDVWDQLPPHARDLLRLAAPGQDATRYLAQRSLRATASGVRDALAMIATIRRPPR